MLPSVVIVGLVVLPGVAWCAPVFDVFDGAVIADRSEPRQAEWNALLTQVVATMNSSVSPRKYLTVQSADSQMIPAAVDSGHRQVVLDAIAAALPPHRHEAIRNAIWNDTASQPRASPPKCPLNVPPFPQCNSPAATTENSNYDDTLMPLARDIKVVAALGDSITVGMFERGGQATVFRHLASLSTEDRHFSFATGAHPNAVALGRILHQVVGSQDQQQLPLGPTTVRTKSHTGPRDMPVTQLNLAQITMPIHELDDQVEELARRLGTQPEFTAVRDAWKMVTVAAGGNNLCAACRADYLDPVTGEHMASVEYVERALDRLLQQLYDSLTPTDGTVGTNRRRVVANVYTLYPRPSLLYTATSGEWWCQQIHKFATLCPCMYTVEGQVQMDRLAVQYNQAMVRVVHRWQSRTDIDPTFRVGVVRAMEKIKLDESQAIARAHLSNSDCFHPNECFHRLTAFNAWQELTVPAAMQEQEKSESSASANVAWQSCGYYQQARLLQLV